MAPLSLVWEVHSKSIIAVLVLAIVFRIVSSLVNKAASKRFKTADEVQVATYRLVGLMHHIVQVPLAAAVLSDPAMWENRLFSATPLSTVMLVISSGYFLHDFIQCIEHVSVQGFSYVIHGAGCATVYLFALLHVPSMIHFYGAGFLMWEISSFPVHFRWFFFKLNASQLVQNINGLALLFSFFFARIVWGFWLSYLYWNDVYEYQATHTPDKQMSWVFVYTTFVANLALNALNTYWFSLIFSKAANAILGKQKDAPGKRD